MTSTSIRVVVLVFDNLQNAQPAILQLRADPLLACSWLLVPGLPTASANLANHPRDLHRPRLTDVSVATAIPAYFSFRE